MGSKSATQTRGCADSSRISHEEPEPDSKSSTNGVVGGVLSSGSGGDGAISSGDCGAAGIFFRVAAMKIKVGARAATMMSTR